MRAPLPPLRTAALLALLGVAAACDRPEPAVDADRAALAAALSLPGVDLAAPLHLAEGPAQEVPEATVRPVAFDLGAGLEPPFRLAGALYRPAAPTGAGVLVAHGHFEGGKSTPEAQEIALRLAARGAVVLAVDTPGVEEWDVPGRRLHFAEGAHGRAFLAAGGSSALALQVTALRRGLSLLQAEGARHLGATGASGGAVQAFWLHLVDPRVEVSALASAVPIPRELRAGGCPCDQLPGWPGPDPRVLRAARTPLLWMTETPGPRPAGLPRRARYAVIEGDHGYPEPMQRQALAFLSDALPLREHPWEDRLPLLDLRGPGPAEHADPPTLYDLALRPTARWTPAPDPDAPYTLSCAGLGPVVVLAGGEEADRRALVEAGLQACAVEVPLDEADLAEGTGGGAVVADRLAGAIARAGRARQAVGAYGVGAWALPVAGSGLPFVTRRPPRAPQDLDPARDPPWVHVPGGWWGANEAVLAGALASGDDPAPLAAALAVRAGEAP